VTATGWRIVPEEHAADAFTGEGAKQYGGRWNSPGVAVVYASANKSLAALEILVHLNPRKLGSYKVFSFHFDHALAESLHIRNLPKEWREEPPPPSIQRLGDEWARQLRSAILAVPSILIPEESNYVLNPAHPDFSRIEIGKPANFAFDPRLLV